MEEFNYDVKNNIKPHKISSMSSLSNDYQYFVETQTKQIEKLVKTLCLIFINKPIGSNQLCIEIILYTACSYEST